VLREPKLFRTLTVIEPNVPWLLEGDDAGEAVLSSWREQNARVRDEAAGDVTRQAELWFDLVNNRDRGAFAQQVESFRRMWLDCFGPTPPGPPPEPLRCDRLGRIPVPTLTLGAEHGMPYSRLIAERLAGCIPGCRLRVVPGVTHFMSHQAPTIFNELVLGFLAEHDAARGDPAGLPFT